MLRVKKDKAEINPRVKGNFSNKGLKGHKTRRGYASVGIVIIGSANRLKMNDQIAKMEI